MHNKLKEESIITRQLAKSRNTLKVQNDGFVTNSIVSTDGKP